MTAQPPVHVLAVGDLHAAAHSIYGPPWAPNPVDTKAPGGYLGCLHNLIARAVPEHALPDAEHAARAVVFLGDIADEPYKRGKIGLDVIHALRTAFAQMREALAIRAEALNVAPPVTYVLPGNHDRTGLAPPDWLAVFEDRDHASIVRVLRGPEVMGLRSDPGAADCVPFALVPYASPDQIVAFLSTVSPASVVMGHFAYNGVLLPNGQPYPTADAVPGKLASRMRHSVLGHIHTASETALTAYTGVAVPYSWVTPDTPARLHRFAYLPGESGCQGHEVLDVTREVGAGVFHGPVPLADARQNLSTGAWKRERMFVRVELAPTDNMEDALALAQFLPDGSEVVPCYTAPDLTGGGVEVRDAPARLSSAAGLVAGGGDASVVEATLREYVAWVSAQGADPVQGVSVEDLVATGLRLARGERKEAASVAA